MKVVSEKEQLDKRRDEIFSVIRFQENEVEKKEKERSRKADKWFRDEGELRVVAYEIAEMKKIITALEEYKEYLTNRIKNLITNA